RQTDPFHLRVAHEIVPALRLDTILEYDAAGADTARRRRLDAALTAVQAAHQIMPYRSGSGHARHITHAGAAAIADPHPNGIALGPAHAPIVAHILAGSGFDRRPERRGQSAVQAESPGSCLAIGQNITHDPGRAGRYKLL